MPSRESMRRRVTQEPPRLADIRLRMPDIAGAEIARRPAARTCDARDGGRKRELAQHREQLVQRRAPADGDVVDLVDRRRIGRRSPRAGSPARRCRRSRSRGVVSPSPLIATASPSSIAPDPARDHGGVRAFGILPRAEDVEVAQADRLHPVAAREHVGIELVDELGDGIRRQRPADRVLDLRQRRDGRRTSSSTPRRRSGCTPASRAATSMLRKPVDVGGVRRERIRDRARNRAERRLVQHDVDAFARGRHASAIADVRLDERDGGASARRPPRARPRRGCADGRSRSCRGRRRVWSSSSSASTRCEPMKPALPVTSQRSGCSRSAPAALDRSRASSVVITAATP